MHLGITRRATEKTTSKQTAAARPFAESPAPEHIRVDPGSIACEDIKQRNPDAPLPVFSTMALAHGTNAAGAVALKQGFGWNAQMDLLWALGYPHVVFIVDGFSAADTKQGILDYWNAEKRDFRWWRDRAKSGNPRVISRRGAFAQVYELATQKSLSARARRFDKSGAFRAGGRN